MHTFYWQLLALVLAALLEIFIVLYVLFFLFYFKQINDWLVRSTD